MNNIVNETAKYWLANGGLWRVARKKSSRCSCGQLIHVGESYLDTNEAIEGRMWATLKMCIKCTKAE